MARKPKPSVLPDLEFEAVCREAFESYDYQDERIRFDSLGRRWTFQPDKVGQGYSVLRLKLGFLNVEAEDTISTSLLASEMGQPMIVDVCKKLMESF